MNGLSSPISGNDLFGGFSGSGGFQDRRDGFESHWQWPDQMGTGAMSLIKLRQGVILGIGDFLVKEDLSVACEYTQLPVVFSFGCSGALQYSFPEPLARNTTPGIRSGVTTLAYVPEWKGVVTYRAGHCFSGVCLYVDPRVLTGFFHDSGNRAPDAMETIFSGESPDPFYRSAPSSAQAMGVVEQIINCPYDKALKRLFLESKALELITHTMASLAPCPIESRDRDFDHQDKLRYAKKLILNHLEDPPDLVELARCVGMSRSKFHQRFQAAFGATPFEFLRNKRLEKAGRLLAAGSLNVTETAHAVGYTNLSHFAKAFKARFGIPPGRYRK